MYACVVFGAQSAGRGGVRLQSSYLKGGWRKPLSPAVPHCTCACGSGIHAKRGVGMEIMPEDSSVQVVYGGVHRARGKPSSQELPRGAVVGSRL
ncbi:unnamed protein product [Taenia asiatica]|uniref:Uncharacterized protein n=1 Tax=Taenia asiatica TaxID=60517 RepID=A0A0R3VXN4_TAEAS|nr:unnamed protein product [Taenia asiatica]